jgi:CRP-like cAMP-binding protein
MQHKKIFSIPKSAWVLLLICNLAFAWWLKLEIGNYLGWVVVDLSSDLTIGLPTVLAVVQFALFALTVDMLMRLMVVSVNNRLTKGQIPVIAVTALSIVIYGLIGLIGFILLYDHGLSHILATTGALGVGAFFIFREWIADVTASIQIQTDHLAGINDYLWISGEPGAVKVVQIDHRMITMQDEKKYLLRMPARIFLGLKYINLSRQITERGIRRRCSFMLTTQNNSNRVLETMETAMKYLVAKDSRFFPNYLCQVEKIEGGAIGYGVSYECDPSLSIFASNNLVFERLLHIFRAAAINLSSDMEITTMAEAIPEAQQRLMDIYHSSVLKVLEEKQVEELSSIVKIVRYEPGEQLIRKGELAESMYFISEGHLEVSILDNEGKDKVVATLWPGDCVGEMSLLTGEPRSANVTAKSKGVLLEVTKDNLTPIFEQSPILIDRISQILTERNLSNEKALLSSTDKDKAHQIKALAQKILKFFFGAKNLK